MSDEFKEYVERIKAILKSLGVDVEELEPCLIYLNYLNYKLAYIERNIYELREKIIFLENLTKMNRKETHK